jgi:hypothetical protein
LKPLMQMQPGNDLPHLLIGTKVRHTRCWLVVL